MRHDNLLLASGVVRCVVWIVGTVFALRFKRWMVAAGFAISSVNSIVFSLYNSHYGIPQQLLDIVNYESTLAIALLIGGFILGTVFYSSHKRWTP